MSKTTLIMLLVAVAFIMKVNNASAQVFRMVAGGNGERSYIEVYEYDYVDVKPCFPGGNEMLMNFINETREYPEKAYKEGIQGKVTCSFVVNIDGSISHVRIMRGVDPSLNKEAVRIIKEMPRWRPGRLDGTSVPVRVICAVPFRR